MRDLDEIVMPGITHWQSPGWFAYFPANVSGPSILAELASAGIGAQGDAVGHEPRAHGDREPGARLAGRPAGTPAGVADGYGAGRRRHPDERLGLDQPRARGRARAGAGARHRHRGPRRLRLLAGALVRRARRARGRLSPRAPRRGRRRGARAGAVASRRRCVGGDGDDLRGASPGPGRGGAHRQLHVQPPQVDVRQLRLQRPLGRRPRAADRDALDRSAVPAQRGERVGRGDRLPRLARPARPALPRPEALVGAWSASATATGTPPRTRWPPR